MAVDIVLEGTRYPVSVDEVGQAFATKATCQIGDKRFESDVVPYRFEAAALAGLLKNVQAAHPKALIYNHYS